MKQYAEIFCKQGYAVAIFDFIGGGNFIQSDGEPTDMSVLTEKADLEAVIEELKTVKELDMSRLFLLGASQGGYIVTDLAGSQPDLVKGLILLYPGFNMPDFLRAITQDGTDTSDTVKMMGMTVGRRYVEDAFSFDIKDRMRSYEGPVIIIHGDKDTIAPLSYSEEAAQIFPDAELKVIEGGDHMFLRDEYNELAITYMLDFLDSHR